MINVKIYGAGSIGNHLAYACRSKGWNVLICDVDTEALERTKNEIYPSRYGSWDDGISLIAEAELEEHKYDLVIIGTPPDTHLKLACNVLKRGAPKALLIEKPLCAPSLQGLDELQKLVEKVGTHVFVGYNHTLTKNTKLAEQIIKKGILGEPLSIMAKTREHWGGIFKAHPWLSGPQDTYLGFSDKGGGALGEHSHAVNIWQHFAYMLDKGKITEVSALIDMVEAGAANYDQLSLLNVRTEKGLSGNIIQDVITAPAQKQTRIQGSKGFVEWHVNWDSNNDAVVYGEQGEKQKMELVPKTRTDDFAGEINHIEKHLKGEKSNSPISLQRGMETMLVIAAAFRSSMENKTVKIDYDAGYNLKALSTSQ
jgi:predicted dehydrogenase